MVGRITLLALIVGLLLAAACREQRPECKLDCTQFEYDNHESADLLNMWIQVYSGRPDPIATLEQDETTQILSTIEAAQAIDEDSIPDDWPEYGHLRVEPIDPEAGYPDQIEISAGFIRVIQDDETLFRKDVDRALEEYLLCTAYYKEAIDDTILEWITKRSW